MANMKLTDQDRKELKFILNTAKEMLIALSIAFTLTFLIITLWKI
jgi:hypothetical protein